MDRLSVNLAGYHLQSPLVLASGIWGTTPSLLVRAAQAGCGAVTAKSCGPVPRSGHVNPTCLDWGHGLINAIGLANPGVDAEVPLLRQAKGELSGLGVPLIASIFAGTAEEFGRVAARVLEARPDMLEVNISCPNVASEFGEPFAADPVAAAQVTEAVKAAVSRTDTEPNGQLPPVIVKLAPNVPSVARIAAAVVEAGADVICAINTMPGLILDPTSGQPILANRSGGLSGPALKPIALKCVYDIRRACPHTPIIGTGGVTCGRDAVEMLMAGANAVGVGSAVYYRGPQALTDIVAEIGAWLRDHGWDGAEAVQNLAHREPIFSTAPSPAPIPVTH